MLIFSVSPSPFFLSLLFSLAIKCYTNDDGECDASRCVIFSQGGHSFQRCLSKFSPCHALNELYSDPSSVRPYTYCCDTDWCNDKQYFLSLISPSPSLSPSSLTVSTGSVVIVVSTSTATPVASGPQSSLSSLSSTSSISSTSLSTGTVLLSMTSSPISSIPAAAVTLCHLHHQPMVSLCHLMLVINTPLSLLSLSSLS